MEALPNVQIQARSGSVHYPSRDDGFMLTLYQDSNRIDSVNLMVLKEEFCKRFGDSSKDEKEPRFQSTSVIHPCIFQQKELFLVQASSMIYPETDKCADAGWIACNSILSGLYGKGISECESVTFDLVMRVSVTDEESLAIIRRIASGFKDCAKEAGAEVTNGSLVAGTYVTIGGVATTVCHKHDLMARDRAAVGDIIVLTKPLGTLIATRCNDTHYKRRLPHLASKIVPAFKSAMVAMRRSNKIASILMKKYDAHAAIDINGFSFSKCASELVKIQKNPVDFKINKIPLINNVDEIDELCPLRIKRGQTEELCGGLLICFSPDSFQSFVQEITETENHPCFVIGEVTSGDGKINIVDNAQIIQATLHQTNTE